jgi:hypothetical protein
MGFGDWVSESVQRTRDESPGFAVKRSYQELLKGVLRRLPSTSGDIVWDREWDVLVILDACRWDAFEQLYGGADWLSSAEPMTAAGSASPEFMERTFTEEYAEEMASTAYVTGNPYSETHVDGEALGLLDEVWRYVWDEDVGTIRPDPLTNQAVRHHRSGRFDRLIVHYMQPHWPYVADPLMYGFDPETVTANERTENPFDRQNRGEFSREDHYDRYLANLEYVVEHVRDVLLRSIEADTVAVTADHGTLFGEYGLYKHPTNVSLPLLRRVPWATTSAIDDGEYEPTHLAADERSIDVDRSRQLADLGYVA